MSICIIQLPSDFEERYKEYRLKLGDKNTERALSVATEAQERAARDLALVSGQMEIFANQFSALSVFQKEIEKNSQAISNLHEVMGASGKIYESMIHSMQPMLNIARDAQMQIEKLGIGRMWEDLRVSVQNINTTASVVQNFIDERDTINVPVAFIQGPKNVSTVSFSENEQAHSLSTQVKELVTIVKSIEEKIPPRKTATGPKFPFTIPAGTRWESIMIQFTTDDYTVVHAAGHSHPTGYADMGFVDRRTNKHNLQWALLLLLAKNGGELSPSDGDANENFKKHKQLLSDKLKSYFGISDDPFKPYKNKYQINLTLSPPSSDNKQDAITNTEDETAALFQELSDQ